YLQDCDSTLPSTCSCLRARPLTRTIFPLKSVKLRRLHSFQSTVQTSEISTRYSSCYKTPLSYHIQNCMRCSAVPVKANPGEARLTGGFSFRREQHLSQRHT
uniref:Uncharacterized protein n=1 Tax=Bubo bubo TaxID=30461 RepID=A0A8C0EGF9_BUBBB